MSVQACTIAVIDDDPRVLESLVNLLSSFGYSAESYKSAEQFLKSGTLSRTSCIITDVEMRANERSRPSATLEKQQLYRPRNHHYGKAVGTVGGVLSGAWCCRLLQETSRRGRSRRIDRFSLCLAGFRNRLGDSTKERNVVAS